MMKKNKPEAPRQDKNDLDIISVTALALGVKWSE